MTLLGTLNSRPAATRNISTRRAQRMALGAVAGPVVFTLGWIILGAISPGYTVAGTWVSPYSAITQPISGLGLGETARYMNAAFVLSGLLLLAGVFGLARTMLSGGRQVTRLASATLLALTPVGLVIIGFFTLDRPVMHLLGCHVDSGHPSCQLSDNWLPLARPTGLASIWQRATTGLAAHAHTVRRLQPVIRPGRRRRRPRLCRVDSAHPVRGNFRVVCRYGMARLSANDLVINRWLLSVLMVAHDARSAVEAVAGLTEVALRKGQHPRRLHLVDQSQAAVVVSETLRLGRESPATVPFGAPSLR